MKEMMKKKSPGTILLCWLLLSYMLVVFGPLEIYFANAAQFKFIVSDFAGWLILLCVVITAAGTMITLLLPKKAGEVVAAVIFGCSLAGYLQIMFINKNLDLLGLNPEGYSAPLKDAAFNLCLWAAVIIGLVVFIILKTDLCKKLISYVSGILLAMQVVALVSLLFTGGEEAYSRGSEADWHFTGAEQYTVSAKENVIVIVLDYFSNEYLTQVQEQYPDVADFLHDFMYYNNADSTYYGTFPSLDCMFSGYTCDPQIPINQWFADSWSNERTQAVYQAFHDNNYKTNLYTEDSMMLRGENEVVMLADIFSNVQNLTTYVEVDTQLLLQTMVKMSCYRFSPYFLKGTFYTDVGEYTDIVRAKDDWIRHQNFDFKEGLEEKGRLEVDPDYNYLIVQHLMGVHQYNNTPEGDEAADGSSRDDTVRGCLKVTEMYLEALKEAGVYDDATIIITSDHGSFEPPYCQPILFVKMPGQQYEESPVTDAPVSHKDLLGTLIVAAGLENVPYESTFFDFEEGELREREFWVRGLDVNYPYVRCYSVDKEGAENVYRKYTYTGTGKDLNQKFLQGPDETVPLLEAFY